MEPRSDNDAPPQAEGRMTPVGAFEGPDPEGSDMSQRRSRDARKIVKLLRSRTRKVLHELGEGLLDQAIAGLRSVLADPAASRMERVYAAESIGRMLAAASQVCAEFGVDNLQQVVDAQKRQRRSLQNTKKQLEREDGRKQKFSAEARRLTEAMRGALRDNA